MDGGVVYLNGELLPAQEARISVFDRGFRLGDAVYDTTRTFSGQPFKFRAHVDRLFRSLQYTRINPGLTPDEMEQATHDVLAANQHLLGPNDDFAIWLVVSRGHVMEAVRKPQRATVAISAQLVDYRHFAKFYLTGAHVITPATIRTPPQALSAQAKISNKMNHIIADFEAKAGDPEAFSLMLDINGNVAESSSANFLWVRDGKLFTPGPRNILGGITLETILELADGLGIPVEGGYFPAYMVYTADEAFLTATSPTILPVTKFNGARVGRGGPTIGPITARLIQAWNELVGVDIVQQALSHLPERERFTVGASSGG